MSASASCMTLCCAATAGESDQWLAQLLSWLRSNSGLSVGLT